MLGFLIRFSEDITDPYVLKSLYCSLIRSIFEYCSVVWSPCYSVHINRIESLQRKFLRYALRRLEWPDPYILPPYAGRRLLIDLESLEQRRLNASALFVFDLLSGRVKSDYLVSLVCLNVPFTRRTRAPISLLNPLHVERHRTNYGCNEPMNRACIAVNSRSEIFDYGITRNAYRSMLKSVN